MAAKPTQSKWSNSDQSGSSKSISVTAAMVTRMPGTTLIRNSQCQEAELGQVTTKRRTYGRRERRHKADHTAKRHWKTSRAGRLMYADAKHGRDHATADEALQGTPDDHLVDGRWPSRTSCSSG